MINDLSVEATTCSEENTFSAIINFIPVDVGIAGFQVFGNGANYGTFQYDQLPISIDELDGNCTTDYEFIIRDAQDPTCSAVAELGTVCCDAVCTIEFSSFTVSDCEDDNFSIQFNLDYEHVDGQSTFDVIFNGQTIAVYNYDELPITISDLDSELVGNNNFTVCNNDNSTCCATEIFLNPCACAITNVTAEIIDCDEDAMSYNTIIDFDHIATTDSFQMGYSEGGNNNFLGVFAYSDLPVTAGPVFWSDDEREIFIVDKNDFFCFSAAYLGIVEDCQINCQIYNVFAESYDCEDGQFYMDVEFDAADIQSSTFEVLVDGINYGSFTYGETFYTVGPILQNCDSPPLVIIQDSEEALCNDFFNFDEPICCGVPACEFTIFETSVTCNEEDGVVINAEYSNPTAVGGDEFFVIFEGATYGPYPPQSGAAIFNVPALENGTYGIEIYVGGNEECNAESTVMVDCVPNGDCSITEVFAEIDECENGMVTIDVEFEYSGEVSDSFEIRGNGVSYGIFAYGELFYEIGPIVADCETFLEFAVIDQNSSDCGGVFVFDEPACCDGECPIEAAEIVDIICEEGLITNFTLIVDSEEGTSFSVTIGDMAAGEFLYNDSPFQFEGSYLNETMVILTDNDNPDCQFALELLSDCAPVGDCIIDEGELTLVECDTESYSLSLTFIYQDASDSFNITILNEVSTYAYADLPIIIDELPVGQEVQIRIADQDDPNCSIIREYLLEQCETSTEETSLDQVSISQFSSDLIIENNSLENISLSLVNTAGQTIHQFPISSLVTKTVKTDDLISGIYFVVIQNTAGIKTKKISILR